MAARSKPSNSKPSTERKSGQPGPALNRHGRPVPQRSTTWDTPQPDRSK